MKRRIHIFVVIFLLFALNLRRFLELHFFLSTTSRSMHYSSCTSGHLQKYTIKACSRRGVSLFGTQLVVFSSFRICHRASGDIDWWVCFILCSTRIQQYNASLSLLANLSIFAPRWICRHDWIDCNELGPLNVVTFFAILQSLIMKTVQWSDWSNDLWHYLLPYYWGCSRFG